MNEKCENMSLREFNTALSSSSPTPGGGAAAAIALGQSASLACMVCDLTLDNEKWKDGWGASEQMQLVAIPIFNRSLQLADEDCVAFDEVMMAFKMPKTSDDEIEIRREAIRTATLNAARVPLETAGYAMDLLEHMEDLARFGNGNAASDVGVAALLANSACLGALMNVEINLSSLPENMGMNEREKCEEIKSKVDKISKSISGIVNSRI